MQSFEDIYRKESDAVYSYIRILVKDHQLAEDLTQETFVKAYRSLNRWRQESALRTWLISIARNTAIDYLRRKQPLQYVLLETGIQISGGHSPEDKTIASESLEEVERDIQRLKRTQRECLLLRRVYGFSIKETAKILGWKEGRVKVTLQRAVKQLSSYGLMREEGTDHETFK
ncbi:RNA polymerase sigma factor [Salisediminibacterium halotolerans]|uniref:RNA polymerase sigma factor n=1 Tax=Salisediminibacterium halotolerans TaxID=517425 RepID=A0A1H9SI14_9BACI|nr:RNA polymerase sigma factor [Salisediminibacterium haloalkalitolerans]SER84617.1 RNA polymerase sigma-70 factor, ECF subfamily [Salisediminibacterium haloalkalitolerans]